MNALQKLSGMLAAAAVVMGIVGFLMMQDGGSSVQAQISDCDADDLIDLGELALDSTLTRTVTAAERSCTAPLWNREGAAFFTFTLAQRVPSVRISLDVVGTGTIDPFLTLYRNPLVESNIVDWDDNDGGNRNALIVRTLAAGTTHYLAAMASFTTRDSLEDMTLRIVVPDVPEVQIRLADSGGVSAWVGFNSADDRQYMGDLPGNSVFDQSANVQMAVLTRLTVEAPLTFEATSSNGNSMDSLTMNASGTVTINSITYNRYTSLTQLATTYAGGTWASALVGNVITSLILDPSPESTKFRSTLLEEHTFNLGNTDGAATITVSAGLRVSTDSTYTADCTVRSQTASIAVDGEVYIAACASGTQTIILADSDDSIDGITYTVNVIGDPVFSPGIPATLPADSQWHVFQHGDPYTLNIEAEHVDAAARLVTSLSDSATNHCQTPVASPNDVDVAASTNFYLAACSQGTVTLTISDSNDELLTYTIELVAPASHDHLDPSPLDASHVVEGDWKGFENVAGVDVRISTDDTDGARLALSLTDTATLSCPAVAGAQLTVPDGDSIYMTGCAVGPVTVLIRTLAGELLETLNLEVLDSAFLNPRPNTVGIRADDDWHEFGHTSMSSVYVVVNSNNDERIVAVSLTSAGSGNCIHAIRDRVLVPPGGRVYLTGCKEGAGHVQLETSDGQILSDYAVPVLPRRVVSTSTIDPRWQFNQFGELHLPGEGMKLEMVNSLAGSYSDRDGYAYEARLIQADLTDKVSILADMTRLNPTDNTTDAAPACGMAAATDTLTDTVELQTSDTLHIRACAVDYSHDTMEPLNLSDAILGELTLTIYRTQAGRPATLVHIRYLTIYVNRLVLTRPVAEWRVDHATYDEDNDQSFRIPVQWAHPVGREYSVPNRARFLSWVWNPRGETATIANAPLEPSDSDYAARCTNTLAEQPVYLEVQDVVISRLGTDGNQPFAIESCDTDPSGVTSVALHYMRGADNGAVYDSNLIARYVFEVYGSPLLATPPAEETSLGEQATPTPGPTLVPVGHVSGQYTGARPGINANEVNTSPDEPGLFDVVIFWNALEDTDGYEVRIDGVVQYTGDGGTDVTYTSSYASDGYQLDEGATIRLVSFEVRGFKAGGDDGYFTQRGVFVPPGDKYFSPWSRAYRVVLGGSDIDLDLTEPGDGTEESVPLDGRDIPGADMIGEMQQNVRELFARITGLEADSTGVTGVLVVTCLIVAAVLAMVMLSAVGMSPMSVMAGVAVFTLVWSFGGPLFFAVPIAMAVSMPVVVLIAGVGLIKTKGLA